MRIGLMSVLITFIMASSSILIISDNGSITHENEITTRASTFIVDQSGSGDYITIQDAVDAASYGDTVFIRGGLYKEYITLHAGIKLMGDPNDPPILDAKDLAPNTDGRTFLTSANDIWIEGIIFRNSDGVIVNGGYTNITFCRNVFKKIEWSAIHNWNGARTVIYNNIFLEISYAIYSVKGSGGTKQSNDIIINNVFDTCDYGIYGPSGIQTIMNNIFIDCNQALSNCNDDSTIISNNIFWNNNQNYPGTPAGNFDQIADPKFIDNEYHIGFDSPAIDNGNNKYAPSEDFSGDERPFDGNNDGTPTVDIGIDEIRFDLYVDDNNVNGPWDGTSQFPFRTIQQGIDHGIDGNIIFILNGTYIEKIAIDSKIKLMGQSLKNTIISGHPNNDVIAVNSSQAYLTGFTLRNIDPDCQRCGISFSSSSYSTRIDNVTFENFKNSIIIDESDLHEIFSCNFQNNTNGIIIRNGSRGINIFDNLIERSDRSAITLIDTSFQNTINNNIIMDNNIGVEAHNSSGTVIYGNLLINNTVQAIEDGNNRWYKEYPVGGNYWSDHTGMDVKKGPQQDEDGSDGFNDIPYQIEGASASDPYPIYLDIIPPVADAGPDVEIDIGGTYHFNSSASHDDQLIHRVVWEWNYGGEIHVYQTVELNFQFGIPGEYQINLTVYDFAGNSDTDQLILSVIRQTPISISQGDIIQDQNTTVYFNGSGSIDNGVIDNYTWSFIYDDVSILLYGPLPSFNFDIPGAYEVILNVTDNDGIYNTTTFNIEIRDTESPIVFGGEEIQIINGDTYHFDGSMCTDNGIIVAYTWSFTYGNEDRILSGVDTEFRFDIPGNYEITLTVFDQYGNHDSDTFMITVEDIDPPRAQISGSLILHDGEQLKLDGFLSYDNDMIIEYIWTFTDTEEETVEGPFLNYSFEIKGYHDITLMVKDRWDNTANATVTIEVIDSTPPIAVAGEIQTVNKGTIVTLDGSGSTDDGTIVRWVWNFEYDWWIITLEGEIVEYTFDIPGLYTIRLTVYDQYDNFAKDHVTIHVVEVVDDIDVGGDVDVDDDDITGDDDTNTTERQDEFPCMMVLGISGAVMFIITVLVIFLLTMKKKPEDEQSYTQTSQPNRLFPEMTERMTVEGKPLGYLIMFIVLAIVCMIAGLAVAGYILIGLASGVLIISTDLLYLVFAAVVALPLSIYSIIKITTKRSIEIGPEGVTIKVKGRIIFSSPWSEIARISTKPNINNSPSQLGIIKRDGTEIAISSFNISGSRLKEGFQLLQTYSQYYCINVDNEAGW